MRLPSEPAAIAKRYIYYDDYWYSTGRWALAGTLIGVFGLLFVLFLVACLTARSRRSAGRRPFRGTEWTMKIPGLRTAPPYTFQPPEGPPPEK